MTSMYAFVRYTYDSTKRKVPIGYIKDFVVEEHDKNDMSKTFDVFWSSEVEKAQKSNLLLQSLPDKPEKLKKEKANSKKECGYFKAQILFIAGSLEKLDKKIIGQARKDNETTSDESLDVEESSEQIKKKKKIQDTAVGLAKQTALQEIIQKEKALKRRKYDLNTEVEFASSNSDESIQLMSTPKRKSFKKIKDLKDGNIKVKLLEAKVLELETEVKKLRDINFKLQNAILTKVQSLDTSHSSGNDKLDTTAGSSSFESKYHHTEGKVFLASDVWVSEEQWSIISSQTRDSKFTKSLAVALWGSDELAKRSVTGVPCPTKTGKDAKPALTPKKLRVIEECLGDYVRQEEKEKEAVQKRVKKYRGYKREKIQDLKTAAIRAKKHHQNDTEQV